MFQQVESAVCERAVSDREANYARLLAQRTFLHATLNLRARTALRGQTRRRDRPNESDLGRTCLYCVGDTTNTRSWVEGTVVGFRQIGADGGSWEFVVRSQNGVFRSLAAERVNICSE